MAYTNDTKPSSSYTNDSKQSANNFYLLWEVGSYLLAAVGEKIITEAGITYNNDIKPN